MIEFKNVKLNIGSIEIVSDCNFKIEDNSVVCFVGNKNTGKSSILKLIAKIYNHYQGEILIDNQDLLDTDKKIAMVFDKREIGTDLTVVEYLKFYSGLTSHSDKNNLEKEIDKYLRQFSLNAYRYSDIDILDEETFKLIQIIKALLMNPEIILFDNLFFSDNLEFNEKLLDFVKTLKGKVTLIFASRNLNFVENIVDKIGIIDNGYLIAFDDKESIIKKAELNRKIEVDCYDGLDIAIEVLKNEDNVTNITFDDSKIIFSLDGDKDIENEILKKLIANGVSVYSFKRENITFEQLYSKFKENI